MRVPIDTAPSRKFDLALLGRFELAGPDGAIELSSGKLAGLLAYLACTAPQPQSRETLTTLLWGSHFDTQAKQNLRQALFRLRRVLGPDALESDGAVVGLNAAAIRCDVARFEALIREGSCAALSTAADLYRGRLLDDIAIGEESWNEWLARERERLLDLALGALMKLGEQELAAGRASEALKAGRRAIALNNVREDAHRLVVQALSATGRQAEALKHYQDLVVLLKREFNAEPDRATRSLAIRLRDTQPPGGRSAAVEIAKPVPTPPADEVASAGLSVGLEQRQLTILVCNLGVSATAGLGAEEMHALVSVFHKVVADAVAPFNGFVAHYLSDAVHVYFGYPAAHELDAERAVRAGFAVLDAVSALKAPSGASFPASAGIATGLVVVGDPLRRTAIGEAPTLAAQLQAVALPGAIVIAASTHRLVGRMFDCRALPVIEMKGLPEPVEAWHVRGEAAGVSRFEARRAGALTPLVGRQEESELLLRRWDQARRGEGQVVLLTGEPGIGKSRIAESLLVALEGEPHVCLRYSCSPHHTHTALHPFIAQLQRAMGFERGGSAAARLDRLEASLEPVQNQPRALALIADLMSVPTDGRYPPWAVSPPQKREMTLVALLDQLDAVAARSPVLIVFEDVHWIDPTSLELLDRIIDRVEVRSMLLVVACRPELTPSWVGHPQVTARVLTRLGRRDSAGIIAGVAGGKALPDVAVDQILAHTDGVPLFIEEVTSTLLESGLLRETMDSYVLDGPLRPLAIPTTLQASLAARLDRLGSVKEVAQIGAAIGRAFSHELIAAVAALAPAQLDAALEQLTAFGLVSIRGAPPDAIYSFKHALVQDAAYATMLRRRRRQLHASIARVLVERFAAMTESQPEVVARHFTEAQLADEAISYWVKAGQLAYARSALREALTSFEQALHLLDALPTSSTTLEQGFELRLQLRPALSQLGESRQLRDRLREAEILAERLNDDRRRGQVCSLLANVHTLLGELDEAVASGMRALAIERRLEDLETRIRSTNFLAQAFFYRSEYERVVELARDGIAMLPDDWVYKSFTGLSTLASIYSRAWLIMSLAQLGRFAEAAEPEDEAIRILESTQQASSVGTAHLALSMLHLEQGDWARACPLAERLIAAARPGNVTVLLVPGLACSAWVLAQLGQSHEALNRLREGLQLIELDRTNQQLFSYLALGRASLLLGRFDDARRIASRLVDPSQSQPGFIAHGLRLLGDIAAGLDTRDAETGEACYRQALERAESRGMRPLVAHCHLGLAKAYLRMIKLDRAREHLIGAATMYRDMGMTYWQEQAEAAVLELQ